jgi:hypothetical protein
VKTDETRDRAVERLLRRSVEIGSQAEVSPACVDAETFAAWTDGALRGPALTAVEAHVAGCARCQSMAALIIRSSPPAPSALPWWRWSLRSPWLVPLTAGAAAVAIWSVVPGPAPAPSQPGTSVNAPVERAAPEAKAESQPTDSNRQTADGKRQTADEKRQTAADNAAPATGNRQPSAGNRQPADVGLQAERLQEAESRRRGETARPDAVSPSPSVAAAPPAPAAAAPARPAAEESAGRVGAADALMKREAFAREVGSPDPAVRWRLRAAGIIERTEDNGATWTMLTTGVTVDLTAGVSTSPSVCWVVGRNGTVLRTTDGRSWTRVNIPDAADLVSVDATDASVAVVTSADGRRFRTSDGGRTWAR